MKAIFFANGFRKRIVDESGGLDGLDELFDFFVDTAAFMKPWEEQSDFDDLLDHRKLVKLTNENKIKSFLENNEIHYALLVGFDGALKKKEVAEAINEAGTKYGILHIRKDFQKFFLRKKSQSNKSRSILVKIKKAIKAFILRTGKKDETFPAPLHFISNLPNDKNFPGVNKNTKKIFVNYRDYYLSVNHQRALSEKYAVFLDQAIPFHNLKNHKVKGAPLHYDENMTQKYYTSLSSYLHELSDALGLKIVICLHPNCPEKYRKYYPKDFIVVRHETGRYAKYADIIVTHGSTSISLAYIYNIKAVLLALPEVMTEKTIEKLVYRSEKFGITLHKYPIENISFNTITPPKNAAIKNFLVPKPESNCLITELKRVLD